MAMLVYQRVHSLQLVGGWTNPLQKYARQVGSFPQGSGWKWKMFETWSHHLDFVCKMCVQIHQKEPTFYVREFTLI